MLADRAMIGETRPTWAFRRSKRRQGIVSELTPRARELLYEWVQAESLRKHCEAVSACMRYLARKQGADVDLWGAVGLLHDMDFERHPNLELSETGHPFVGVAYLREHGWSDEITRAIL